jgi:hypothetical protein
VRSAVDYLVDKRCQLFRFETSSPYALLIGLGGDRLTTVVRKDGERRPPTHPTAKPEIEGLSTKVAVYGWPAGATFPRPPRVPAIVGGQLVAHAPTGGQRAAKLYAHR